MSHAQYPLAPTTTLLPFRLSLPFGRRWEGKEKAGNGLRLTSRQLEHGLLLGALAWGACKLGWQWEEKAVAGGEDLLPA